MPTLPVVDAAGTLLNMGDSVNLQATIVAIHIYPDRVLCDVQYTGSTAGPVTITLDASQVQQVPVPIALPPVKLPPV